MFASIANGYDVSPSAVSVNPLPVASVPEKSIVWTFSPALGSRPCGVDSPSATTVPASSVSSHATGSVASLTSVARFGPSGR